MYGTISWNIYVATFTSIITLLISLTKNVLNTALIQSFYVFGLMFLIVFLFRFIVGLLVSLNLPSDTNLDLSPQDSLDSVGSNFNQSTPDADQYLQDILRQNYGASDNSADSGFQTLNPTRLSTVPETQADPLVEAVRSSLRQE